MEYTDKAAYNALTNTLSVFTSSNISPATLGERLFVRNIIGKDAYESARQQREASQRRRELLDNVMGCGKTRAFQDLVDILVEMEAFEWLGEKLTGMYIYTRSCMYEQCINSYTLIIIIICVFNWYI